MKKFFATLLIVAGFTAIVYAAVQTFDGAGKYIMSDFENHDVAKQRAQMRAERDAQKKAGVALKIFSRSVNAKLTDDEISAVTNNIISISDLTIEPVPFEVNGVAGVMYTATLKAQIDTDGIYAWLKCDDTDKVTIIRQNNGLQTALDNNDEQAEALKSRYSNATPTERQQIKTESERVDKNFLSLKKRLEGAKLIGSGDYDGAIKLFDEAEKLTPDAADIYILRGIAYSRREDYILAARDYTRAIQLTPNDADAYNYRGLLYERLQNYQQAFNDFDKAIELNPNDAAAYEGRGRVHQIREEYSAAVNDFTRAIQLNPNHARTYLQRGLAYQYLKNYPRAIADFDRVIELNPTNAVAYRLRGICNKILGDDTKAQADFDKAKELGYEVK